MEEDMHTQTVSSLGFELYGTQANPVLLLPSLQKLTGWLAKNNRPRFLQY